MADEHDKDMFDIAKFVEESGDCEEVGKPLAQETSKEPKTAQATERVFKQLKAMSALDKALRAQAMPGLGYATNVERALRHESAIERFTRDNMERQRRINDALSVRPCFDTASQVVRAFDSLNEGLERMKSALDMPRAAAAAYGESFRMLNDAFPDTWRELRGTGAGRILDMLEEANRHWQKLCEPVSAVGRFMKKEEDRRKLLYGFSSQLYRTGNMLAGLDFDVMSAHLKMERPLFAGLESSVQASVSAFSDWVLSCKKINITDWPGRVFPGAADSIHATGLSLRTLQGEDADEMEEPVPILSEEDPECMGLLASVDPRFLKMLTGAWESLKSHNPDRERHILASLRELLGNLLRHLAPDENLVPWINAQATQNGLMHEGRPTRQARIRFICRNKSHSDLESFLGASIKEFAELMEVLNRLHKPDIRLSDKDMKILIYAAEAKLKFLINVAKGCG